MTERLRSLYSKSNLSGSVDGDTVVYFRIIFGLVASFWVLKRFASGAIQAFYVAPRFHFHYWSFGWVEPFPDDIIQVEFAVLGLAAVLITLGAGYRVATLIFALGFTHLFLVDKCLYQNHYYLICLLSWLLVFIPANRELAVDAWLRPSIRSRSVPRWAVWLLRFQFSLPYFYGGVAKLNADWLAGEPMRSMLAQRVDFPVVGSYFSEPWCVFAFVYGGLLFDLLFVPLVLSARFQKLACCLAIIFHFTNAWLFTIGVFPWLMLLSLLIYFRPGTLRRADTQPVSTASPTAKLIGLRWLAVAYIVWQLLFPLRHYAIPGNTSWTEEGHCFSWRMLVRGKRPAIRLLAEDPATGKSGAVDLRRYVTEFQIQRVGREPRLIHELANYVATDLSSLGFDDVEVRALALVSLNGRKPQLLIDPRVDLAKEVVGWQKPAWIVPLSESLRTEPWNVPMSEWEQAVVIPVEYRSP